MTRPTGFEYRLVRPPVAPAVAPVLDPAQVEVVRNQARLLKVLAGPGTGKTTTLVEAVVDRVVDRGVDVGDVLVLTFGRRAAAELRDRITARLAAAGVDGRSTVREPVARTIHSYAYGILRLANLRAGQPAPTLLPAAEQDALLRELLGRSTVAWPKSLQPALSTYGFAAELRDFLTRAVERGLDPVGLDHLARERGRPDWAAAAATLQEYRDVTSFARPGAFDTAELVTSALAVLENDPALLAEERVRRRRIFVDEYQDVDPAQARLLQLLAQGADEYVVVGDPDQSIYAFRGSEAQAMSKVDDDFDEFVYSVALRTSRRAGSTLLTASRRVAARLGHDSPHHALVAATGIEPGAVTVRLFRSSAEEAAAIAADLRRAHLEDGVPWSRMAVLARSVALVGPPLRRALVTAGVPVEVVGDDVPLAEAGAVAALLAAVDLVTASEPPRGSPADDVVTALLLGPIGRLDPLVLRRLRRRLARSAGTRADELPAGAVAAVVLAPVAGERLSLAVAGPVERLRAVLAAGTAARPDGVEAVLWAVWQASGLAPRWERASVGGGLAGQAADRELDAVVELFEAAARYVDARPGTADPAGFLAATRAQLLPVTRRAGDNPDVVRLLTAHAAKGLEWDVVAVAGVQEGLWPDLRARGSVLSATALADAATGLPAGLTGHHVELALAEERRLFYVAVTRARQRLLVSAVRDADQAPSRFLDELDPLPVDRETVAPGTERPVCDPPRGLHLAALVAELRAVVTDPVVPTARREEAAAQLAALAAAGVDGADPAGWWGLLPPSTDDPIRDPAGGRVSISPSKLEAYQRCQLRALLGELGARNGDGSISASLGVLVHEVASTAPDLTDLPDLRRRLDDYWRLLDFEAPWHADLTRRLADGVLDRLSRWYADSRARLTELAVERPMSIPVGDDAELVGRVDRLERDDEGRTVVVDLKTSSTKPSETKLAEHPQLAAYQLAVTLGAFDEVAGATRDPGGGQLVQLKAGSPTSFVQTQPPLTDVAAAQAAVLDLARVLRGPRVLATVDGCDRCDLRACCPLTDGRQVTG